ncbi:MULTISPECIES: glycosyltransferase family 2 protein [unclassified Neorhizobium]|uniref:glycosyltransferase family 2 protein n=1 Tax=unclassified Neorhizobium TaxID=2629175 RepID=UPI001FF3D616|nr:MULTISPECIES: glycosyltransferase family 2 protein [unclassified Neorhizobium]MCJ9670597.1 glycosyltransferase family 2 protein [Neorhizobium sp. SHOUNA12B]MCJ9747151.1 glycosyltransferase family 2 protein [Neorhizobium sp. SHOUNA12A]
MIEKSAFIVGAARDCEEGLLQTLPRLSRLQQSFTRTKFFIVTNDSEDRTEKVLRQWAEATHDARIQNVDGLAANVAKRTPRLAVARNLYMTAFRDDLQKGIHHDLLIVLDLDGVNANLVEEPELSNAINSAPDDWAGLFANQRDWYYDIWALRHPSWCPTDCWKEVREARRARFNRKKKIKAAVEQFVTGRQKKISPDDKPIPVQSAFGGFGIYRTEFLRHGLYLGLDGQGEEVCEHVALNESIGRQGGKLYIVPSLLNDTPPEHVPGR